MARPRKSEQLKKRMGTLEAQRVVGADAEGSGEPVPPVWLSAKGAEQWERLVPTLTAANLVTLQDSDLLGIYCDTLAEFVVEKRRRKERNQQLVDRLRADLMKMADKLGMNPVARTRVRVPAPADKDDLDILKAG